MTRWMRTAVLKKVVVGLAVLASVAVATESTFAAAGQIRMGRVPALGSQIERVTVSWPGDVTVRLHGGFNLKVTVHTSAGNLLAQKTCFEVCELEFQTSTWGEIRIRIDNPEPETQGYWLFVTPERRGN